MNRASEVKTVLHILATFFIACVVGLATVPVTFKQSLSTLGTLNMHLRFVLALLISSVISFGLATTDSITVTNLTRTRSQDNGSCHWSLIVSSQDDNYDSDQQPVSCAFDVAGPDCQTQGFGAECFDNSSHYTVNGGHDPDGFFVVPILDKKTQMLAWFGWSDEELDSGLPINEIEAASPAGSKVRRQENDTEIEIGNSPTWTLTNIERGRIIPGLTCGALSNSVRI